MYLHREWMLTPNFGDPWVFSAAPVQDKYIYFTKVSWKLVGCGGVSPPPLIKIVVVYACQAGCWQWSYVKVALLVHVVNCKKNLAHDHGDGWEKSP